MPQDPLWSLRPSADCSPPHPPIWARIEYQSNCHTPLCMNADKQLGHPAARARTLSFHSRCCLGVAHHTTASACGEGGWSPVPHATMIISCSHARRDREMDLAEWAGGSGTGKRPCPMRHAPSYRVRCIATRSPLTSSCRRPFCRPFRPCRRPPSSGCRS